MDIPPEFQRVKTVRSSERILHDMQRAREDGALRWCAHVSVATDEENDGCEEEDNGWEGEGKPEADVLCWICKKKKNEFFLDLLLLIISMH